MITSLNRPGLGRDEKHATAGVMASGMVSSGKVVDAILKWLIWLLVFAWIYVDIIALVEQ